MVLDDELNRYLSLFYVVRNKNNFTAVRISQNVLGEIHESDVREHEVISIGVGEILIVLSLS